MRICEVQQYHKFFNRESKNTSYSLSILVHIYLYRISRKVFIKGNSIFNRSFMVLINANVVFYVSICNNQFLGKIISITKYYSIYLIFLFVRFIQQIQLANSTILHRYVYFIFPYLFLGILFAKYYVFDLLEKRVHTALYFAGFILSLIALFIFTHDNFSSYTLSRIIGMIITIFVGGYFYSIRQKLIFLNKPILKSLDENCIGIYLLHLIIILFLFKSNFVIQFMNQHTIIAPILLFLTSLLSSWGTSILIRKTSISIIIR